MESKRINEEFISNLIEKTGKADKDAVRRILAKAEKCKGLTLEETAVLINITDPLMLNLLIKTAKEVKQKVYGKRVVMFSPLYTGNECVNNCKYCGFRKDNKELCRRTLTDEEILAEAEAITAQGHKRILLICGEHPTRTNADHLAKAMKLIYDAPQIDCRRINVEAAPMSVEDYVKLKEAGIGTYVIFQETYHRETYDMMHPQGIKKNYDWRISAIDRAFEAGIDDVGVGVLLGLYDYKFDVLALLEHCRIFGERFGVGPHTVSVPRLQRAEGWDLSGIPYPVNDEEFKKIVAVFRVSVPYTGIILSTRETPELRDELLNIGVTQMSAGSKTAAGGYTEEGTRAENSGQFELGDERSVLQVIESICDNGYIPSFCTACYRRNRTGHAFMSLAKEAEIHKFCLPNAILTFKELLLDYGNAALCEKGERLISAALEKVDGTMREDVGIRLKEMENGRRDIFY